MPCKRAYTRRQREENPDLHKKRGKDWYERRKEHVKAKSRKWQQANKAKAYERVKKWKQSNPDKLKQIKLRSAHKRRSAFGVLSRDITSRLFEQQNGLCACCGASLENGFHLDHILPLALGGTNTDDNVQLLTPTCNLKKGAKHPNDYMKTTSAGNL